MALAREERWLVFLAEAERRLARTRRAYPWAEGLLNTENVPPEGPFVLSGPATDVEATKLRHSAASFRRMVDAMAGRTQGVQFTLNSCLDLKCTATGTDVNLSINSGYAFIRGTQATPQGMYHAYNDATKVIPWLTNNPAHATLDRIDLCVFRINDTAYSGGTDNCSIEAVTGTPAGSPVAPAAPANSIILAQILVVHASTVVVPGNITDKRVPAALAPVKLFESSGALGSYDFQNIPPGFRELELRLYIRDGGAVNAVSLNALIANNDAGNNYYGEQQQIKGTTTTVPAEQLAGAAVSVLSAGGGTTAGLHSSGSVRIPGYAGAGLKNFLGQFFVPIAATTGNQNIYLWQGWWNNVAAINRLILTPPGAVGFDANSYAELWGHP